MKGENMKNWHVTGFLTILFLGIILICGCTSTGSTSSASVTTTPTLKVTQVPPTAKTITKEVYNPKYSRGDLILINDPVDQHNNQHWFDLVETVYKIDLKGKKVGELIINITWEDPTYQGQVRYNYFLMYESTPGVWLRVGEKYESAPGVWSIQGITESAPAKTIDNYKNELIKRFPNVDVENTITVRV